MRSPSHARVGKCSVAQRDGLVKARRQQHVGVEQSTKIGLGSER
jgi:hypothetical protein